MKVNQLAFHFITACCFIPGLANASAIRGAQSNEDLEVSGYKRIAHNCVSGHNIVLIKSVTPALCGFVCTMAPACKGFEFYHDYKGPGNYKPQDCQLQSSADTVVECSHHNLDMYIPIKKEVPTKAGLKIVSGKVYEIRNMYTGNHIPKTKNQSYLRETAKAYGTSGNKFYTSVGPESHADGCSLWKLTAHGDDTFTIRNMYTGNHIPKTKNQSYLRETVQKYGSLGDKFYTSVGPESNGDGCSLWKLTAHGDDTYTIRNMYTGNNIPKTKNQSFLRETAKKYGTNKFYTSAGPESNGDGCSLWSIKPYPN